MAPEDCSRLGDGIRLAFTRIAHRVLRPESGHGPGGGVVHAEIEAGDLPDPLQYLEIDAPDTISTETLDIGAFGRHWHKNQVATRQAGDHWLYAGSAAVLRVPSVIAPATWNLPVNPRHPDSAGIRVVRVHNHGIDPRLK
jgi:RES domain-containing protein